MTVLLHHDRAAASPSREARRNLATRYRIRRSGRRARHRLDPFADRVGVAKRSQVVKLFQLRAGTFRRRTFAPVAIRALPKPDFLRVERVAVGPEVQAVTLVFVRSSTSCSSHHPSGRNRGSARALDAAQVPLRAVRSVVRGVRLAADKQDRRRRSPTLAASARSLRSLVRLRLKGNLRVWGPRGNPTTRQGGEPPREPKLGWSGRFANAVRLGTGWGRCRCPHACRAAIPRSP